MYKIASVEDYINRISKFKEEVELLRAYLLASGLEETIKWGIPCYVRNKKNVVGIAAFEEYAGIWFYQGALLSDKNGHLINAQEGKTKAMRQWRFSNVEEIISNKQQIADFVQETILNFDQGKEIKPTKNKPLVIPNELQQELNNNSKLAKAFDRFSLTNKRIFCEHISEAKRESTKQKRLEKILPMIMEQVGLHDKYK